MGESVQQQQSECDVVVVGGGSAGFTAAVAAARRGSRVMLIEKTGRLGGMGPLAFVHTFCGLYHPGTDQPARLANVGLPAEIELAMRQRTGQDEPSAMGRVYVLHQHPEVYDALAKELVAGEADLLDCRFHTECLGVDRHTGGGFQVTILSKEAVTKVRCRSVVDCSADALVAKMLDVERAREQEKPLQRPAYIFALGKVGHEVKEESFKMRLALDLVHAVRDGKLPEAVLGATVRESVEADTCFVSIDLDTADQEWDPSDRIIVEEAERMGRDLAWKLTDFLKQNYAFFEQVGEPVLPRSLGVRESYRWIGQHVLTAEELIGGVEFDDVVAYAGWPLEMREDARGARMTYFDRDEASQIPLRSLTSATVPGVYCAGRCMSASHDALASVRVMGTCFATGQAAGMAASMYAGGVEDVNEQARMIRSELG